MIVIVMGVSGSGKTTVGKLIAQQLGWRFEDADDYHSAANKAKMSSGQPLTDQDREPWLGSLREMIKDRLERNASTVVACSALKNAYREMLVPVGVADSGGGRVFFLYLKASFEEITSRLAQRKHEFMNPALLKSQFQTLEEPTASKEIRAEQSSDAHGEADAHWEAGSCGEASRDEETVLVKTLVVETDGLTAEQVTEQAVHLLNQSLC